MIYTFKAERSVHFGGTRGSCTTIIDIPEPTNLIEKTLQEYVMKSMVEHYRYQFLPFVFYSKVMMRVARDFLIHRTGSRDSLFNHVYEVFSFCKWIGKQPDQLIEECNVQMALNSAQTIQNLRKRIDEYIFFQKDKGLLPTSISNSLYNLRIFFRINDIDLNLNFKLKLNPLKSCRSITLEELQKVLSIADLRKKVTVGILAVSGIRPGTLVKLQYRHVKHDLEKGIYPIHMAIESQITKGSYCGYSTFINTEVGEYLKEYLNNRRKGTKHLKPEVIQDNTPLIKQMCRKERVEPMKTRTVGILLRELFFQSGILTKKPHAKSFDYELTTGSLRKFFRTQMSVLGVEQHFIEYMLGHKKDAYFDVKMVGIDYLRRVYNLSGISISETKDDKIVLLKKSIERLGYNPEEILKPEFLKQNH